MAGYREGKWGLKYVIFTRSRKPMELFARSDCIDWLGQSSYCPMSKAEAFFTKFTAYSSILDSQNPS